MAAVKRAGSALELRLGGPALHGAASRAAPNAASRSLFAAFTGVEMLDDELIAYGRIGRAPDSSVASFDLL